MSEHYCRPTSSHVCPEMERTFTIYKQNISVLMFSMLVKYFSRQHFEIFFLADILQDILKKYLLSGKNSKNIINLSSSELAQSVIKMYS